MAHCLLVFSLCCIIYIYFIYPFVLKLFAKISTEKLITFSDDFLPSVSIVIPAHNEESVIQEKILNHLKIDYPEHLLKIIVLNDSSTDRTQSIAEKYSSLYPSRLTLFNVTDGLGKTNAINQLMPSITSDIVVFSDANVYLESSAIKYLTRNYIDPNIGGVAGELNYINQEASSASYSNGLYWKYEEFIKKNESATGSLMGADGSIFSIRTCLYRNLPNHVLDDFSTSIGVVIQGYRFIFEPAAKAYEKGAEKTNEEFTRKVRISNRSYNTYRELKVELHKNLRCFDLFKLYSHKVIRWYTSLFLFMALASNLFLIDEGIIFAVLLLLQITFYFIAFVGYLYPKGIFKGKLISIITYFTFTNIATIKGVYLSLIGKQITRWKKAETSR